MPLAPDVGRVTNWLLVAAISLCLMTFSVFLGSVLFGKFSSSVEWMASFRLHRVAEFLLLLASAVFFMIAALAAERLDPRIPPAARRLVEDEKQ